MAETTNSKSLRSKQQPPLKYIEPEPNQVALKAKGLPVCKLCGSGIRTDLDHKPFCPNDKTDCPLIANK
ncbi:MAG: hypothetical protein AB4372_04900 [Xenococcus sp. (in: cyanobacteria)]